MMERIENAHTLVVMCTFQVISLPNWSLLMERELPVIDFTQPNLFSIHFSRFCEVTDIYM